MLFQCVLCSVMVKEKHNYGMPKIIQYYKSYDEAYNAAKEIMQQECYRLSEDEEWEADYENMRLIQKSSPDWSVLCMGEFPENVIEYVILDCEELREISKHIVENKK